MKHSPVRLSDTSHGPRYGGSGSGEAPQPQASLSPLQERLAPAGRAHLRLLPVGLREGDEEHWLFLFPHRHERT